MPLYQVDAVAEEPFRGSPAAECLLECERPEAWMQSVASEMDLSERAFVRRREDGFAPREAEERTELTAAKAPRPPW